MEGRTPVPIKKQTSLEAGELNKAFSRATQQTRLMIQKKVLSPPEVVALDAMFRQATQGDGSAWALLRDPKFMVDAKILATNGAWTANRGMDRETAKREYVEMVEQMVQKHHVVMPPSRASSTWSVATSYTDISNN